MTDTSDPPRRVGGARARALLDAVVSITTELALPELLERLVDVARDLTGARYAALGVLDVDGRFRDLVHRGMPEDVVRELGHLPGAVGLLGQVFVEGGVVRTADVAAHPASVGFPAGHPPMRSFLGVPITLREGSFGALYLAEKRRGQQFTDEDEDVLVTIVAAAGLAIANARMYEQSARRQRRLEAAREVMDVLLPAGDSRRALNQAARRARDVATADVVAVLVPTPSWDGLVVEIVDGRGADLLAGLQTPMTSLSGRVFRTGVVAFFDDVDVDGRIHPGPLLEVTRTIGIGRGVIVPLRAGDDVLGVMIVGKAKDDEPFGLSQMQQLGQCAVQAALALERGRAVEHRERLALYQDRDRIARDLHDHVIQRLFSAGLKLESLASPEKEEMSRELREVVDDLDETIRVIRSTIYELQQNPDVSAFAAAVQGVLDDAERALEFPVEAVTSGRLGAVASDLRTHVLAVLRETLSNVTRHASATAVRVEISTEADVRVTVADNGVGIGPAARRSGLRNLRTRAENLGGRLTIAANTPAGTVVEWRVPRR